MRPTTMGLQYRIFVFADSLLWQQVGDEVESSFNDFVYTPKAERSFVLTWKPLRELNTYNTRMNLFFIGTAESGGEVNDYLQKNVPAQFLRMVKEDRAFYFFKDDLFARDQISVFMMARDTETFLIQLRRLRKKILEGFREKYYARLEKSMFEKAEQLDLEKLIAEEFGYRIRVQHDYFLATTEPADDYIWLRRIAPDRSISIWRVDGLPERPRRRDLIQARDKMAALYYSGDTVFAEDARVDTVRFAGRTALKLTGSWINDSLLVGGPFRTWFFRKTPAGAWYALDVYVMAPNKKKTPYLDQLEVIARSFRFTDDKPDETIRKE